MMKLRRNSTPRTCKVRSTIQKFQELLEDIKELELLEDEGEEFSFRLFFNMTRHHSRNAAFRRVDIDKIKKWGERNRTW